MLNPWPGVYSRSLPCPALPCLVSILSSAGRGYSSAFDDGTREGGEPILLDGEACLVPLSSN